MRRAKQCEEEALMGFLFSLEDSTEATLVSYTHTLSSSAISSSPNFFTATFIPRHEAI